MKLVLIEWVDSKRMSDGWIYTADMSPSVVLCQSVGWLVKSKGGVLTVMPHCSKSKKQNYGAISIPECAVKRIFELKKKK